MVRQGTGMLTYREDLVSSIRLPVLQRGSCLLLTAAPAATLLPAWRPCCRLPCCRCHTTLLSTVPLFLTSHSRLRGIPREGNGNAQLH